MVHSTYSPCIWEPNSQNQPKLDYTFSTAQRKAGRQHTKDHHDTGEWFNSLVGTWLFNWESVGLGSPSWLDQFIISAVVHCEAALTEFGSILHHCNTRLPPVHSSADAVAGINPRYLLTFCQELHALACTATADCSPHTAT